MSKITIWLITGMLLFYFIFTSGLVYEMTGSDVTTKFIVPYSAALSGERAGLIGVFTKDDLRCAEWLTYESDQSIPIAGDGNAWLLMRGYVTQPERVLMVPPPMDVTNEPMFTAYGDSITLDDSVNASYVSLITSDTGMEARNLGVNSSGIADMFDVIYTSTITPSTLSTMLIGYNDVNYFGNSANALTCFERSLYSYIVKLAIPTTSFRYGQDASIVYSEFWGNTSGSWGIERVKWTDKTGESATFSATGSIIYIDILQATGSTLGLKVVIDGQDSGTFNGSTFKSTIIGKQRGKWYAPYLLRFAGLENTTHTVTLETTAGVGDVWGDVWINWVASTDGNLKDGPYVYIGNCLLPKDNGSTVVSYNTVIENCVKTLTEDGLCVTLVDVFSNMNLATDFTEGYPNDLGHRHIADAFLAKITPESIAKTNTGTNRGGLYYVFIRTWNTEHQKLITGGITAGMRTMRDLSDWKLDLYKEVFRSGKAVVYERK